VSSGLGPPCVSHASFLNLRLSSCALSWLRVLFFFLMAGVEVPLPGLLSSAPLPAGVAAAEPAGVFSRERAGVNLPSAKASSTTAVLPLCVIRPASIFQISGPWVGAIRRREHRKGCRLTESCHEFIVVRDDDLEIMSARRLKVYTTYLPPHPPNPELRRQDHPTPLGLRNSTVRPTRRSITRKHSIWVPPHMSMSLTCGLFHNAAAITSLIF